MAWTLVPSLVSLRAEFDRLAPARDHASDGSIGDGEHSQNSSDHNPDETGKTPSEDADSKNEVHAIDVDRDLKRSGWSMERAVQIIVLRHRSGVDNRLQNVIYNRRIWSRSWNWTARAYTGPNPHDHHAHFGARYTTAQENDTRPWGLLAAQAADEKEREVPLGTDKIKLTSGAATALGPQYKAGQEVDGETALNLLLIWASRGGKGAAEGKSATEEVAATAKTIAEGQARLDARVAVLEDWFSKLNTPQSSPEQTAVLLHAALGPQAAAVGRILATFED